MTKGKKLIIIVLILLMVSAFPLGVLLNKITASGFDDSGFLGYFSKKDDKINILVFGVDAPNKDSVRRSRSDSIMLFSMNSSGKDPVLISIPRDTIVDIPGRQRPEKVNHAHAYGDVELLVETVENLFDIKIDHFIRVNYKAVEEMVDALGGVEIDVPMDMRYNDPYDKPPLHINISKGLQILDGKNSVHFLRFRKGYANQDLGRIEAQQNFVVALKKKVLSPSVIPKIPQLIEIFHEHVDTNITQGVMLKLSSNFIKFNQEELTRFTLPGNARTVNGVAGYFVNEEELKRIKIELSEDKQTVGRVAVLNGCGVKNIATKYASKLEDENISVESIGNHENYDVEVSFIEFRQPFKKQAQEMGKLLGIKDIRENDSLADGEFDISVIIGKDLDI